jgi:hypothetical protein
VTAKTLFVLLLLCCSLGCTTQLPKPVASQSLNPFSPATPEQVEAAKQRIHLLRANMTEEQLFATLGLSNCYGHTHADAGGTVSRFWISYTLRTSDALNVVRDLRDRQNSKLLSVSLDGVTWSPDENN